MGLRRTATFFGSSQEEVQWCHKLLLTRLCRARNLLSLGYLPLQTWAYFLLLLLLAAWTDVLVRYVGLQLRSFLAPYGFNADAGEVEPVCTRIALDHGSDAIVYGPADAE